MFPYLVRYVVRLNAYFVTDLIAQYCIVFGESLSVCLFQRTERNIELIFGNKQIYFRNIVANNIETQYR